ncbi:MAG: tRNA pseudouridine(55) synthase TruB [Alphaproteobacteria bacterium]|nr:tRNA pseudouridine(55) synthase TruB [Alphaproteobacteria bacterium]
MEKINGFLVIYKPLGITSNQALGILKRAIGKQKIGHLGTLDPLAEGVLPVALGEATKAIPYLTNNKKTYEIKIKWGEQTSTDDTEGEVIKTSDNRPKLQELKEAINTYQGKIKQTPPNFSACKINGQRAYDLARQGKEVKIRAKDVEIFSIEILDHNEEESSIRVFCSKGTYMRSLARDLGVDLNCYGHCTSIKRTQSGDFNLEQSIMPEDFTNANKKVISISEALKDLYTLELNNEEAKKIKNGLCITKLEKIQNIALAINNKTPIAFVKEVGDEKIRAVKVFNL